MANNSEHTLCWDCANSTNSGCRWSKRFKPVKGWEAKEQKDGYLVVKCPEFIRNSWGFGRYRDEEEYKEFERKRRYNYEYRHNYWESHKRTGNQNDNNGEERV